MPLRHTRTVRVAFIIMLALLFIIGIAACDKQEAQQPPADKHQTDQAEETAPAEAQQHNETAGAGEQEPADDAAPQTPLGEWAAALERLPDGYRVAHRDTDGIYASSTRLSQPIDGYTYAVHTVRRSYSSEAGSLFQHMLVVVNPKLGDLQSYPLYDVLNGDLYQADSIAGTYGFMDAEHVVYIAAVQDEERVSGYSYQAGKMNILSGETEVLIDRLPEVEPMESYSRGWLNQASQTLVLNSRSGKLWSIDLRSGQIAERDGIRHEWPFILTAHSPDGSRFWYSDYYENQAYKLFDDQGNALASLPFGPGYDQYPAFVWSEDSRYAAIQDTWDQSDAHILGDNVEYYVIAPQRIRFYNTSGELLRTVQTAANSGKHIELIGWLAEHPDYALIREYAISDESSKTEDGMKSKNDIRYYLLDIPTGKERALKVQLDTADLTDATPARISSAYQSIYWVNLNEETVIASGERGLWLQSSDADLQAAIMPRYDEAISQLTWRDGKTGAYASAALPLMELPAQLIGREWLVDSKMQYIRLQD